MRYRLKDVPVQVPAPTAFLAQDRSLGTSDLLETLANRRKRAEDIRLSPGGLQVSEVAPRGISLRWSGSVAEQPVAVDFLHELGRWAGVSRRDFMQSLHESPVTLQSRIDSAIEERGDSWGGFFVRLEGGQVRGILPHDYQPLDHLEAATAFAEECARWRRSGVDVRVDLCEESLGDLSLAACAPSLAAEVRQGDWLYAGIALSNSEWTTAALEVKPRIYRAVCANGAISQEAEAEGFEIRKVPEPARSPHAPEPAPLVNRLKGFRQKLAQAFDLAFRPERVEHEASVNQAAASSVLVSPFEHLQHLVAQGLLSEEERDVAQRLFAGSDDSSLYGLANAVTAAAHGQRRADPRRAAFLERLGAEIVRGEHGPPVGVPVWV